MSDAGLWALRCGGVAAIAALPFIVGPFWLNMAALALIYSLVVFSINTLTGLCGLLSFGQAGFVGAGAYTYGVLSVKGVPAGLCIPAALAVPTLVGLLLGLPAARLKGHYLAIGTLGFGVLCAQLFTNMVDITRGPMGLLGIRSLGLDRTTWFYVLLVISLAVMSGLNALERRTFLGLVLKSVKDDDISAAACGVATFGVKLFAFCASAFLAGLSGVLLALYLRFLTPDLFAPTESFRYLMMAVVGGAGSATGGLLASLALTAVPELLRSLGETNVRLLVYGVMVLFVLWFVPGGIGGLIERLSGRRRVFARSAGVTAPETSGDTAAGAPAAVPMSKAATTPVLEIKGVCKSFGGVNALRGVDLTGHAGEVHGLIGPNGAGKSTLIGCITGVNRIDGGELRFGGRRIEGLPVHRRARLGIARTFQKIRLSQQLTVFENVAAGLAARWLRRPAGYLAILTPLSAPAVTGPVCEALAAAGILPLADVPVSAVPYGQRHLVELARALVAQPEVLLLDEPATGLTDAERERLTRLVRRIAARGALVVLVEHDLEMVGRVCDRVSVIEYGRRIFTGTPREAQRNPEVVRAYLGSARFADAEGEDAPAA